MTLKIQIINGPNLNLLGKREPDIYGHLTLDEIKKEVDSHCQPKKITADFYQSNIEGELVGKIQEISESADGLIINAAAFTHTSVAILDALNTLNIPKIEVHISNVFAREEFRHKSMISKSVNGIICGFGLNSYILAVDAIERIIKDENK
ncbi:3-dehydroquinate dehydratase II [Candidatus Pelagibacter sp. IMCC9063]|uniref:type II 3-dehydroquinate dehydratase n=1 Tax=Pelagibacter sp. (strain IMCC9063) TaxID=1002672 RepID=UPI00020466E3|nr:type II 3-dehydroquinate dehydratase [Candidatus Pelagibacter sp. IMCC9063]AEA81431.1 3-dehydroquinate dehydratase II [Candidatus Pelagibacter sp. IMCC9063]